MIRTQFSCTYTINQKKFVYVNNKLSCTNTIKPNLLCTYIISHPYIHNKFGFIVRTRISLSVLVCTDKVEDFNTLEQYNCIIYKGYGSLEASYM